MTIEQTHQMNEEFQKSAVHLSELFQSGGLTSAASTIIRCAQRIDEYFVKLLGSNYERQFNSILERMEKNMDEIVFILDQIDLANRERKISVINDFLKEGYDLLSIYSKCFDQAISKRIAKEDI